jgi:alkylated DNA repair dioxygenase AlkB
MSFESVRYINGLKPGCAVIHYKGWLSPLGTRSLTAHCLSEAYIDGTTAVGTAVPRLQKYYQQDGTYFSPVWRQRYARWKAHSYPSCLSALETRINQSLGLECNSVLVNLYRDGNDTIAPHRDDQPSWGVNPTIVSLSIGSTRSFLLEPVLNDRLNPRSLKRDSGDSILLSLESGDLLVMKGETQLHYQHSIPREPSCSAPRWNLTFRKVF